MIANARAGDLRAFGRLVDAHQLAVRGFLRRLMRHVDEAEDIAQDAFMRAFESLGRFDGRARCRTYVCGIAFRVWRDRNRAWVRRLTRERIYSEETGTTENDAAQTERHLALRQAMDMLPEAQRAALALCLGAEFTHEEAAAALQIPLGTIKSHITRGCARLKAVLGEDENSDH